MRIPLHRPFERNLFRALQLQPLDPLLTIPLIHALPNLLGKLLRPLLRRREWFSADAMSLLSGNKLLRNTAVPDMMQIKPLLIEKHRYPVPALGHVLRVQRLVDVADKVDHELGCLRALDHV